MATATVFFSCLKKSFVAFLLIGIVSVIGGCGKNDAFSPPEKKDTGGQQPNPNPTPTPTPSPSPTPSPGVSAIPHTIVVSYPKTNAVENLGAGFYRRLASVIVTDQDGNAVADGTPVQLNIIDSILVKGLISPLVNDSIGGSTITSQTLYQGDGVNATTFDTANVNRNFSFRFIQPGDRVFLINSDGRDKDKVVNVAPTASDELQVSQPFSRDYPAAPYDGSDLDVTEIPPYKTPRTTGFVVGASLLGAEISGEDVNGNLKTGIGSTVNGIARFWITYPANKDTILSGCLLADTDERSKPTGSAEVYLVATANSAVTTVDNRFCFSAITGGTLTAFPTEISGAGTKIISVTARDGGDSVLLPYVNVTASIKNAGDSIVTFDDLSTKQTLSTDADGTVLFDIVVNTAPTDASVVITFQLDEQFANPGENVTTTVTLTSG